MQVDRTTVEKLDALQDVGRLFVEHAQVHGMAVEAQFDVCAFDRWRRKVNDVLYAIGGCEDLYYQRFSRDVVTPRVRDLEEGLRILSAVRDDVSSELARAERLSRDASRPSASYH
jgi:hypothetical protein